MAEIIDTSIEGTINFFIRGKAGFELVAIKGFRKSAIIKESEIESIVEIDAEVYRSGGGAAVGAIVGGLLTGGVGLIAGAAIGGRRKSQGAYLIKFKSGDHVAFKVKGKVAKHLSEMVERAAITQLKQEG